MRIALPLLTTHFYPRPPRGGRQVQPRVREAMAAFLSTPSARRATMFSSRNGRIDSISIHALREEGDFLRRQLFCAGV